jgi:hypothetical protein
MLRIMKFRKNRNAQNRLKLNKHSLQVARVFVKRASLAT